MKKLTVVAAGLLSVLVIACGGSDSGSDSNPDPNTTAIAPSDEPAALTKDEFVAQADEICRKSTRGLEGLDAEFDAATAANDYPATAALYDRAADSRADTAKDLKALGYEGEESATVDAFIGAVEDQIVEVRHLADAMRDLDISKITSYGSDVEKFGGKAEGLALAIGLEDCSFDD